MMLKPPNGILIDYGGTLVEEVGYDPRAGNQALFDRAAYCPRHVTFDDVLHRAERINAEVAARRDEFQIETPWPGLTRLIYDFLGIRFAEPMPELELAFWRASVTTREMPGARDALLEFHRCGVPCAVVSNCSFGPHVLDYELSRYRLTEHLAFIMVTAEYAVRKPNVLLFETAAARLDVDPADIWFIGDRLDTDVAGAQAAGMTPIWLNTNSGGVASWSDILNLFYRSRISAIHAS